MTDTPFIPRPAQAEILAYEGGPMGVSAVPGSGKTFTLSLLAARLVEKLAAQGRLDDREVLVVTFTNSAVENFRGRIAKFVRQERGLLAGVGYRVRTLHGLAHDIVRERPALVGLSESFDIIDERTAGEIKRESVVNFLRSVPELFAPYIDPDYLQNFRRIERYVIDDAIDMANVVIRVGKELQMSPETLQRMLNEQSGIWPLLDFGLRIYADYQRSLQIRGAVDFDDLIVLALQALRADEGFLHRLQERWPYVLEDEAQDSSLLQETMLRMLTNNNGNWVRVGDPNQAINTTFTSADTRFLREFVAKYHEQSRPLPNSGRSAQPIIDAANHLIDWSVKEHPVLPRDLALTPPHILPTGPGDPQPNPEPGNPAIHVFDRALSPDDELRIIMNSLTRWLPEHPERTAAVLVPENNRGFKLAELVKQAGLPYDDSLLRSDSQTRATAEALSIVLKYVVEPQNAGALEDVWTRVWWPRLGLPRVEALDQAEPAPGGVVVPASGGDPKLKLPEPVETFGRALAKLREPEDFLFPGRADWLDTLGWMDEISGFRALAEAFRRDVQRWTEATILPVDELLLTLGNNLFSEPADLALTHRLAVLLAKLGNENPTWRLSELAGELKDIAENRRRILGFSDDGGGYEPKPGVITIATMHAAKGLEWDRVYLTAVNSYSFPGGDENDSYRGERWFVRDSLNLVAEAEEQLRQLADGSLDDYVSGVATRKARQETAAERLRLLYVGITRARRELILTYNTGRQGDKKPTPAALAFDALLTYVDNKPAAEN